MADLPRLHVLVDSLELAESALAGGAPLLQVRLKGVPDRERHDVAARIAERCRVHGAVCIVNDRIDVALAIGADGVHLGADDLPVEVARRLAGRRLLVGGTAREPATACRLVAAGADYLGVGPCYETSSKRGLPAPGGPVRVRAVAGAADLAIVAVGGVTAARMPELIAAGAWGVAVIGAVRDAPDPAQAVRDLLAAIDDAAGAGAVERRSHGDGHRR